MFTTLVPTGDLDIFTTPAAYKSAELNVSTVTNKQRNKNKKKKRRKKTQKEAILRGVFSQEAHMPYLRRTRSLNMCKRVLCLRPCLLGTKSTP